MPHDKIYDVMVAGELNVDIILNHMDRFPEVGKEILAEQMTLTLGSSSAIFASNLSVLGTKVTFAGTLARDYFGDLIVKSLSAKGVHTGDLVYTDRQSTGATIALNFGEDRAMITYPGAMTLFSIKDIPDRLFESCRHLHVSSIFLSTALKQDVLQLFQKAKSCGLTTSLDPQWDPAEKWDIDFKALLAYVDVFIPNENELRAITGIQDLHLAVESIRSFENIVIVKSGCDGANLWKGKEHIHQPAFVNSRVVDSIGAGDSFAAGFIHKFVQGKSLRECLEFAALTGAINTTQAGGTAAFASLEVVRHTAQAAFQYRI